MLQTYVKIIEEQERRGFVEKVPDVSIPDSQRVHYIPHHPVRKDSTTVPVRIVYDCSSRQSRDHACLNDCLESTPPALNNITSLLVRFRLKKFAVTTDIEKAFLNIVLHEKDRDVTRFLWLSNPKDSNSQLITFRFKVVLFGATCSPFILSATISKHLELKPDMKAAEILSRDLYVDNALSSFNTETELLTFYQEARELMKRAGMNLSSWVSNNETLRYLAADDKVLDYDSTAKVLGMRWDPETDTLTFAEKEIPVLDSITKRDVLKYASRIYDPLGILSPVTVRAKILMQDLWEENLDLDVPLPEQYVKAWNNLATDLRSALKIQLSRQYIQDINTETGSELETGSEPNKLQLHVFVDASVKLYGAAAYILNHKETRLVIAKNRIAPVKKLTLPQLELMAAVIGARLYEHLQTTLELKNEEDWPVWDGNIPSEKLEITTLIQTTPVTSVKCLADDTITTQRLSNVINIQHYSKYHKLLCVTALLLRFIFNCRTPSAERHYGHVTAREIDIARLKWIKDVQQTTYQDVIEELKSGNRKQPIIRQLRPFLDSDNFIRCGGRIHYAQIPEVAKFPYLLPDKHYFTKLLIRTTHERLLHVGASSIVTHLRQYWIPAIRRCVNSVLKRCVTCKKVTGKPFDTPDFPPLPKIRVEDAIPFRITGVDFTGHLYVREQNGRESKAYICLFTCASTRAVHLEVVPDLSTASFMQAFRRFSSRHSLPEIMVSDNCTMFEAASQEIHRLYSARKLHDSLSSKGTEWRFIPKRAPWYGGWWERLIGMTKEALKKVLGRSYVNYQTLQTIVTEIEAVLNDRPLTYVTSGVSDPEPLTPSHLLYGRTLTSYPHSTLHGDGEINENMSDHRTLTRCVDIQRKLISNFRQRWRREYLTGLREYHQAHGKNEQTISEGDVVQIHDDGPRTRWKLAVVTELIHGNDGLVRSVVIKSEDGITNRPITKLYPLEVLKSD
ncbi:uncharacterized protein LOC123558691 [Mercenaria mercenaria]|uniref:uncharacterized protein LOC123558691 n=1 Tax=Mercenaria mercenaria TaxID=6596 RepID=UPI00234F328E|nr:uncharacterized protein LOC123558691 [Mercenaria mercenaria]